MSAVSMIINALKPRSWDDVWSNASSQAGAPSSPEVSAANLFSKTGASGGDSLGPLLLRQDDGALSTAGSSSLSEGHAQSSGGSSASKSSALSSTSASPSPTLVGSAGGFQINLVWDSSVASAPSGFESAIASAATYYTTLYSNKEVINIGVGYGKINGTTMSNGALGESEALGYNLSYSMVASAMKTGASASSFTGKVNYVAQADASLPSTDPTHGGKFFVSEAETKALGLIPGGSASSSSLDGYISLSNSASYEFNQTATPGKYDAVGIAEHELSEVMGHTSSLGSIDGANEYTPLDLFRYSNPGARDLTPGTGYFSINNGTTKLGTYNNPSNGGDAGDWASILSGDSYNAFMGAGTTSVVSPTDVLENAVLGYHLTAAGSNATQHLGLA